MKKLTIPLGHRPNGLDSSVAIHPHALVESAKIGKGTRIWGFSHVMEGSKIGSQCNIGEHVFVEKGVRIGDSVTVKNGISLWDQITVEDHVFLGPHVVFTNDLRPRAFIKKTGQALTSTCIKKGASVGAGAIIVCGITIGRYSFVGAGAVVTRSVPDFTVVVGNPARPVGKTCRCAQSSFQEESSWKETCPQCPPEPQGS